MIRSAVGNLSNVPARISAPIVFSALCLLGTLTVALSAVALIGTFISGDAPWAPVQACCEAAIAKVSFGWLLLVAVGLISMIALVRLAFSSWLMIKANARVHSLRKLASTEMVAGHDCLVLEDARPLAFCGGLVRPRVFLSRNLINELGPAELAAVVAHEAHHQNRRDPLRNSITRVMAYGFFFLPMLREFGQKCVERSEIAADQAAVAGGESERKALASALLSLHGRESEGVAVSLSSDRIGVLAGEKPSWIPSRNGALLSMSALGVLLAGPVLAAELVTRTPVGIEALGLHVCLAALIVAPLLLSAGFAWTRPQVRI